MLRKFRKKNIEVEAMQWDGSRCSALNIRRNLAGGALWPFRPNTMMLVPSFDCDYKAVPEDWIVKEYKDDTPEFYICKPDVFLCVYDEVIPG